MKNLGILSEEWHRDGLLKSLGGEQPDYCWMTFCVLVLILTLKLLRYYVQLDGGRVNNNRSGGNSGGYNGVNSSHGQGRVNSVSTSNNSGNKIKSKTRIPTNYLN